MTKDMRPRKIPAKPEPPKRSHHRKPVTSPIVDPPPAVRGPPPGVVPPMPEVYSNESDPPLNLDLSEPASVRPGVPEPFWHAHLFIVGLMIVALVIMVAALMWGM